MGFIVALLFALLSSFSASYASAQTKAEDTERKTDINTLHVKLEEHYAENGGYPTLVEVLEEYDQNLPGIDEQVVRDPAGQVINKGDYTYEPSACTAIDCGHYVLKTILLDGTEYKRDSLN